MSDGQDPIQRSTIAPDKAVERVFGYILTAVGGLWAGLCGACTLAFLGTGTLNAIRYTDVSGLGGPALLSLVVGLIGALPGIGLFFLGRSLLRSAKSKPRLPPLNL